QAEDGIRAPLVTGVQTCALPICSGRPERRHASDGRRVASGRGVRWQDERPGDHLLEACAVPWVAAHEGRGAAPNSGGGESMKRVETVLFVALLVIMAASAGAEQNTDTPGPTSATATIQADPLPAPPQKFGAKIERP